MVRDAGRIDFVVNNAGIMSIGLAERYTEEQVARQMDVNFMCSFRVSRAALPPARPAQWPAHPHHVDCRPAAVPGCALYCASKLAQEALAEVLPYDLTGTGVGERNGRAGAVPVRTSAE
jgi:NAD(P)-dependent dehydrogenase (short-subunit alcohol dehydrogenase family)